MRVPLLSVRDLHVRFDTDEGLVHAVRGVSFHVDPGEVVAVVGESGSGKTVTALSVLGLVEGARVDGAVRWKGRELLGAAPAELRRVRGGEIGCVFQDPLAALNPVQPVGRQIGEMLRVHRGASRAEAAARAVELLTLVGVADPQRRAREHPHRLSGGMRQRVLIAMAIACDPALLIADEPTTALDVTVQAQVLEVLMAMRDRIGSAVLLVTHDLGLVAGYADRVVVMYAGRVVETAPTDELFEAPGHPYTQALLAAVPRVDAGDGTTLAPIAGSPPSPLAVPPGCAFHPRCPIAHVPEPCAVTDPALLAFGRSGHACACHLAHTAAVEPRP